MADTFNVVNALEYEYKEVINLFPDKFREVKLAKSLMPEMLEICSEDKSSVVTDLMLSVGI